jgi:hypothetical protein
VTRVEKPQRNEKLERFCAKGIFINMLRSKIGKQALQQGFSGRSRWLLHNLGLMDKRPLTQQKINQILIGITIIVARGLFIGPEIGKRNQSISINIFEGS